jgi:CRP-like cAMP-binding protein
MTAEPGHRRLDDAGTSALERYLETAQFPRGACLMREGSPGDACYFIVLGEVRVEVERPDFDSDGVVSFMGPGTVCGEFGLLDDSPRSASVWTTPGILEALIPGRMQSHACTAEVPR